MAGKRGGSMTRALLICTTVAHAVLMFRLAFRTFETGSRLASYVTLVSGAPVWYAHGTLAGLVAWPAFYLTCTLALVDLMRRIARRQAGTREHWIAVCATLSVLMIGLAVARFGLKREEENALFALLCAAVWLPYLIRSAYVRATFPALATFVCASENIHANTRPLEGDPMSDPEVRQAGQDVEMTIWRALETAGAKVTAHRFGPGSMMAAEREGSTYIVTGCWPFTTVDEGRFQRPGTSVNISPAEILVSYGRGTWAGWPCARFVRGTG